MWLLPSSIPMPTGEFWPLLLAVCETSPISLVDVEVLTITALTTKRWWSTAFKTILCLSSCQIGSSLTFANPWGGYALAFTCPRTHFDIVICELHKISTIWAVLPQNYNFGLCFATVRGEANVFIMSCRSVSRTQQTNICNQNGTSHKINIKT